MQFAPIPVYVVPAAAVGIVALLSAVLIDLLPVLLLVVAARHIAITLNH